MAQFEVGKVYFTRSACNHDCVFKFEILARSAKTVTIHAHNNQRRRGIVVRDGVEQFKPFGTYSMCAIIRADRRYDLA